MVDHFPRDPQMRHDSGNLRRPARFPAKWNHFADKDSRQVNKLERDRTENRFPLFLITL
jgi:hypothetical protein